MVARADLALNAGRRLGRAAADLAARAPEPAPPGPSGAEIVAALKEGGDMGADRLGGQIRSALGAGRAWLRAHPIPPSSPPVAASMPASGPPTPRTVTIVVRMPSARAELVVRGEVGRGNPDEWYGPSRVIHSPPLVAAQDYLVGAFWTDATGRPATRSQPLRVEPGHRYEVDLRTEKTTAAEVPRSVGP